MFGARTQHRSRSRLRGMSRLIVATSLITSSFVAVTAANVAPSIAAPPTGMFTQISAGYSHTCAVDAEGAIWCWGSDSSGQLGNGATTGDQASPSQVDAPAGVGFTRVSAGKDFTCAVSVDGSVYCWGENASGQLGNGDAPNDQAVPVAITLDSDWLEVSAGDAHACATNRLGDIFCWGEDGDEQLGDGSGAVDLDEPGLISGGGGTSIGSGAKHTCLLVFGTALCWGADTSGALGNGLGVTGTKATPSAVEMPPGRRFVSIAPATDSTCALASDGTAWCWGADANGQLGNGVNVLSDQASPFAVVMPTGKTFTRIDGGTAHTCAVSADGLAYCWGSDAKGQVGNGSTVSTPQSSPVAVTMPSGKRFTAISAGGQHTCALTSDGLAYCWGDDTNGQLGNGAGTGDVAAPTLIAMPATGAAWTAVSAGASHTCALASDGAAFCWGSDQNGQLGDGSTKVDRSKPTPVAMPSGRTFTQISAGVRHTCAISSYGTAYCWGNDQDGQLGNAGTLGTQFVPSLVASPPSPSNFFTKIAAGTKHSCALASDGTAWCWGDDASQQLGNGSGNRPQYAPVAVVLPTGKRFVDITVGEAHSCAIADDGFAYCWGSDASGQLGNGGGLTANQTTPSSVSGDDYYRAISAGSAHTCAVQGSVVCWGSDADGQLGNGATSENQGAWGTTTAAFPLTRVAAGASHTCAIREGGDASCWGDDTSGQLGDDDAAADQIEPVAVATGGEPYVALAAGGAHTCAATGTGPLYCWGSDASGQLGDGGTATDAFEPVEVPAPYLPPTLTVVLQGQGRVVSGETGSTPKKIDCSGLLGDCTETYAWGTTVTLTAAGDSTQWPFAGWVGGACSGTSSCKFTITSDVTVTARFGVLLTVTKSTAASGTLTSITAPGFICGADCTQRYAIGTNVRITADPASGYTFRAWTGCTSSSATTSPPSCTVYMGSSKTVSAAFGSLVNVTKLAGRGSISSSPSGITCSSSCTSSTPVNFVAGTVLTLTATLSSPYTTIAWSGNCTPVPGSPRQCKLTVGSGPTTVNADIS